MKQHFQIAIDGPVGAGKSTVSRLLAQRLGILYVDTGAMYRAAAWLAKREGVDWKDGKAVAALVVRHAIELKPLHDKTKDGSGIIVLLDGEDISTEIRTQEMGEGASVVSQFGEVRQILVARQREMASKQSVVMEGRDIGTNVLPKAQLKIYLDADLSERVRRKQKQLGIDRERVERDLLTRDKREMSRKLNPLRPASEAWVLDTSSFPIIEVVDKIALRVYRMSLWRKLKEK